MIFYVKKEHAEFITEVEAETVGTGIMGRMVRSVCTALLLSCSGSHVDFRALWKDTKI